MKTLWVVTCKELVDLFRDHKTIALALLLGPIIIPTLILSISTLTESRMRTQLESTLELPVIGAEHAPNLMRYLKGYNIEVQPAPEEPDRAVREQQHEVILAIDATFAEQWRSSKPARAELIYDSSRQDSHIPVERLRTVLAQYSATVGALRTINRGVSPQTSQALQLAQRDVATPEARRGMLLAFLPYLLIISSFLGGAALVIDVTAGERERQSLEPLLATPAGRNLIMSGKILAACLFGMLALVLILLAFKLSFHLASGPLQRVDVSVSVMARLLLALLPMVLIGCTLLTLIAAAVKSVKEAQSYFSLLTILPIIPTILLMVNPIKNQLWQFSVPFLAQNQIILKLVRSETITVQEWSIYLGSGFGLGLLLWLLAARLYHRENLAISS
ncbi:MAG: ABC transporter permease [Parahaliea sp.]